MAKVQIGEKYEFKRKPRLNLENNRKQKTDNRLASEQRQFCDNEYYHGVIMATIITPKGKEFKINITGSKPYNSKKTHFIGFHPITGNRVSYTGTRT